MELRLERQPSHDGCTLGTLFLGDDLMAFTLEDVVRTGKKLAGETAIPMGRYQVVITMSPHFKRMLPELLNVPDFTDVRIHGGNTAADTSGCVLVGQFHTTSALQNCAVVLHELQAEIAHALAHGEQVWLTIQRAADPKVNA